MIEASSRLVSSFKAQLDKAKQAMDEEESQQVELAKKLEGAIKQLDTLKTPVSCFQGFFSSFYC